MNQIKNVEVAGTPQINRRVALQRMVASAEEVAFMGSLALGGGLDNVSLENKSFGDNRYGMFAGRMVDGKTLLLQSGQGVQFGKYGNPIPVAGAIHGAPLDRLNPRVVDQGSLRKALGVNEGTTQEILKDARVWMAQVEIPGEHRYDIYAVSYTHLTLPTCSV